MSHQYVDNFGHNFLFFFNQICQKVRPVLKALWKKLSDGTLKHRKIKFEVFSNWRSKKCVKFKKKNAPYPHFHHPCIIWQFGIFFSKHPKILFSLIHVTGYMDLKKNQNSMYPGYMDLKKKQNSNWSCYTYILLESFFLNLFNEKQTLRSDFFMSWKKRDFN